MPKVRSTLVLIAFLAVSFNLSAQPADFNASYDFLMAKFAAESGDYDQAINRIDRVIEQNPANPVLLYERSLILLDASRIERAETELKKLVHNSPDFYDAQRLLGRVLLDRSGGQAGKVEDALVHLQAAFRINPDDIGTGMTISQILVSTSRVEEAEKILSSILERTPDNRAVNYNYAQVLTKLGRGSESRPYLERVVTADPTYAPAVSQLLDLYQRQSEWAKAATLLEPLVEDQPLNVDLQKQQAFYYLRAGMSEKARDRFEDLIKADPKDERSRFYLAEALNDLDDFSAAEAIYRKLIDKNPSDPELLISFALNQMAQRRLDDAAQTFKTILALDKVPENARALAETQLASIEYQKGNLDEAAQRAQKQLILRDQPNIQAINIALDVYRKQESYGQALALLSPLLKKFPEDPFLNARQVEFMLRSGETDKARAAATTQLRAGKQNSLAVAEAYAQVRKFDEGLALLEQLRKSKPDDIDVLFQTGALYERSGKFDSAEKIFLQLLEKDARNAQTLNYLAYMWAERGQNLERAEEMLLMATDLEPRNGAFIDSLGWVYFRQNKLDLAERHLKDAARLLPRDATVQEHLGDVYAKRGDYPRALEQYRNALKLDPDEQAIAQLHTKIAAAEKQTTVSR